LPGDVFSSIGIFCQHVFREKEIADIFEYRGYGCDDSGFIGDSFPAYVHIPYTACLRHQFFSRVLGSFGSAGYGICFGLSKDGLETGKPSRQKIYLARAAAAVGINSPGYFAFHHIEVKNEKKYILFHIIPPGKYCLGGKSGSSPWNHQSIYDYSH
jgi:hypothetical protein